MSAIHISCCVLQPRFVLHWPAADHLIAVHVFDALVAVNTLPSAA
jgi:hypothetical protein